ncbi:heavy metal-binding domain-containing protein [Corynebacterium sp. CCM 9185]|uniref:Heavy metal-binding domain-containing protein n=1 Tax=Corynebacterium marambiense TaxID=2765364 RepID=A0ABS0VSF8_9CORY|nr:heavy metal-binding domain-containing protein [Corynebacterium marambiense]MBI8999716.1 heavy metal-binding domain-containing protein [Corynebacterium marambiense]MCK7662558.1 heavy metal-binding domain-containing protein [Corynebacterium marambiense]MCX7541846.1 heavy metal-binding domain-containing protein [Corynebacterium marambiense]
MIITTTDSVAGREVYEYLGVVTGTGAAYTLRGSEAKKTETALKARDKALHMLREEAAELRADAILGLQVSHPYSGGIGNVEIMLTGTAVRLI